MKKNAVVVISFIEKNLKPNILNSYGLMHAFIQLTLLSFC